MLVPDRSALVREGVDVAVLADLLDRPVVIDSTAGLVMGSPRTAVGKRCGTLRQTSTCQILTAASPPQQHGKKRLLIAFSSGEVAPDYRVAITAERTPR